MTSGMPSFLLVIVAATSLSPAGCAHPPAQQGSADTHHTRVIELANGRWFTGTGFEPRRMYIVDGVFAARVDRAPDSVIDLAGGFVVPPFGEAHNHNVDASTPAAGRTLVQKYLGEGVFYAQNPANVLRAKNGLAGLINVPTGLDATFSNAVLTAPGGHPMGLFLRNLGRGAMLPTDSNSTEGFLWTITDKRDLENKWPRILASHPDFIKALLLYSEEYEKRKSDTAFFNWRGFDPKLLPEIVQRAHAAGLRVMTHVETAADFHNSLVAGVDEIGHLPGFRGNERQQLPTLVPYVISDDDAKLAAQRGTIVITTVGGVAPLSPVGPDSLIRRGVDNIARTNLKTLKRRGVRIAIGSDSYRTTSVPEALYINSLGVFSKAELLRAWTEQTARAIFPRRAIGRLEPGYEASLLVLDGDPTVDFDNVTHIRLRIKQGEIIPSRALTP